MCSVDGRDSRGSIAAHGDGANCTYPQLRHNQAKSPRSVLQNGSVSHVPNSPLKKPAPAGSNAASCAKQQWNPHPPLTPQNILQRTVHTPTSPNSFSSCPSTLIGRAAQQGGSIKSPSPLSVCSSPSRTLESFSPRQRSRHSSTSSLSEQGAPASVFIQGVKPSLPTMPCSSPKLPFLPTSPCSRLEGILQHYKDSSASSNTNSTVSNNQSNHQMSQAASSTHPNPGDKRNGAAAQASNLLGRPLGQILGQQKSQQHITNSFPASSLLSAAAKAQLANQKTLSTSDALSALPLVGLDKEQQSKVLISTLNSNLHPTSARAQSLTTLLLPHSLSQNPPEKTLRRKRQRRSPTVLSMLKETQLSRSALDLSTPPLLISPSHSPSSPPIPVSDNLRLPVAPSNAAVLRLQEAEDGRKPGLGNPLPFSSPSPSQPLSALLQLLSMQNAQNATQQSNNAASLTSNRHTHPSPSSPVTPQAPQCDGQPALQVQLHASQHQNSEPSAQLPLTQFPLMGDETTMNLKTTSSNAVLNLSQSDLSVNVINQMSSASCLTPQSDKGCGPKTAEMCADNTTYQTQSNHNQADESKGKRLFSLVCKS